MDTLYQKLTALSLPAADGALPPLARSGVPAPRFRPDGKFRILFLPDSHYDSTLKNEAAATVQFLREVLRQERPDLVILGGDNVRDSAVRSYYDLLAPVLDENIPFTMVFGNHDEGENEGNKESTVRFLQTMPGCLTYDADPALHGCANHFLPIYDKTGTVPRWGLWLLDSGNESPHGYDGVRHNQLEWFSRANAAVTAAAGRTLPSLAFQHIICQEPAKAVFLRAPNKSKCMVDYDDGTASARMMRFSRLNGLIFEHAGASYINDGQWTLFAESGVKAVFSGHDHNNSFTVDVNGMRAEQCPGYSWCVYGHDLIRGVRVIDLEENKDDYSAHTVFTCDLARKPGSEFSEMIGLSDFYWLKKKIVSAPLFRAAELVSKKGREAAPAEKPSLRPGFTVTAHSGCLGLPANSVEAMEAGVRAGAKIVEFDLRFAADGTPVCSHNAPRGGEVPVREVFAFLQRRPAILANVDVKTTEHLDTVQAMAEEMGVLPQLFYTGVHQGFVEAVRAQSPKIPYYLNASPGKGLDVRGLADLCESLGAVGINLSKEHLSPELTAHFHSRGMPVSVYTVNRPSEIRRVLACAPDNITSLRPDLVCREAL